jgi:cell shape-determining protein MreC
MRFQRLNRYLLLLAGLFLFAVLNRSGVPGEEMLPDAYRATVHQPLLQPLAAATHDGALDAAELRSRLAVAERQVRELTEQLEQTHQLHQYFAQLRWEAAAHAVSAWVYAVDADEYRRTFRIDRGARHGVQNGMPVVCGRALLGVVARAETHSAVVRRVDDPSFRLEVEIETEGEVVRGVAQGDGDRGLDVRFIAKARALRPGDRAFTSRYHENIPPGLYVGEVRAIDDLDEDGLKEVALTPAAALGRWALVHVLAVPERPREPKR